MTVTELSKNLQNKNISSVEITRAYLDAIKTDETSTLPIHAYIRVMEKEAVEAAKKADQHIAAGKAGPLTGIPVGIKDNMNIKSVPTTCASRILEGYTASYDATVCDILINQEGMVPLGKLNMDEFAMGSSTETSYFGITRNPVDKERIPGGSSGGSAAAIGGKLAPVALGSDTGGSIRQPAALCGVVGMKPTYGTVSRYGLVAFASSLDQIGPLARNIEDTALILKAIMRHDPKDSTSLERPAPDFTLKADVKGMKIGIPNEYFIKGLDADVESSVMHSVDLLKNAGAEIINISLPHSQYAVPTYYIVATAEASSNLERYDGVKYGIRADAKSLSDMYLKTRDEGFGDEVKRRIMLGTYALSAGYYDAYYLKALKARTLIKNDFDKAFEKVDVILSPTSPTPAFKIGEKINDPIAMYLSDIFTISVNLAGLPALSMPGRPTPQGLPVGVQLIANLLEEEKLLNIAYTLEKLQGEQS